MRPSFHPRLVNGPFDDPTLFIPFLFINRAMMFALGDIAALAPRDILKISHVFITHTHMDHFVGFDRLLRLHLGREKSLYLYGPQGFRQNVEGKLAGYSWNLVENYSNRFALNVIEVLPDRLITSQYVCRKKFVATEKATTKPFEKILLEEPAFTVSAVLLDHGIPCLGLTLEEKYHLNIRKEKVVALGLETGPWLNRFKQALYNQQSPDSIFVAGGGKQNKPQKKFILGELADQITKISPGQKICYIVDVGYTQANLNKIIESANNADHLYIEAAFLEKHSPVARLKNHLTARQAGTIAAKTRAKKFTIFHFSPRYTTQEHLLQKEAIDAYKDHLKLSIRIDT
jgi:ribonuclease Z